MAETGSQVQNASPSEDEAPFALAGSCEHCTPTEKRSAGAQDGAFSADRQLQAVIDSWPTVSDGIKDAVVLLVTGGKPLK